MAGLGIAAWDALLIGDGAGSGTRTMGIGHACVLHDRPTGTRSVVWGGWSGGSVIMAELFAFGRMPDAGSLRATGNRRS